MEQQPEQAHSYRDRLRSQILRSAATPHTSTITHIDNHHRHARLPQKNRPMHHQPHRQRIPASEGHIMLIHLLTCLALSAVTLTLFARFFLDIGHTEEHSS
jgi:hypothetical protein